MERAISSVGAYFGQDAVVGEANPGIVDRLLREAIRPGSILCRKLRDNLTIP
jgi:hypothetical protein